MKDKIIAVDIGGSYVRVGLFGPDGKPLVRNKQPTRVYKTTEGILDHIVTLINLTGPDKNELIGIGIGLPGLVDPKTGILYESWNLPELNNIHLKPYFESQFNAPSFFGNDAHLAAMGEFRYGAGRGTTDMVYMTVSTGIGGGVIVDGKRLLGTRGFACEIGEQVLANTSHSSGVQVRSLESLASGPNIAKQAMDALRSGRQSMISSMVRGELENISAEVVADAAKEGDELANELLSCAGSYIGLGLVNLIHIFNPELIVLGGGVMNAGELILRPIRETVDKYTLAPMKRVLKIAPGELGDDAGLLGAVALVFNETGQTT